MLGSCCRAGRPGSGALPAGRWPAKHQTVLSNTPGCHGSVFLLSWPAHLAAGAKDLQRGLKPRSGAPGYPEFQTVCSLTVAQSPLIGGSASPPLPLFPLLSTCPVPRCQSWSPARGPLPQTPGMAAPVHLSTQAGSVLGPRLPLARGEAPVVLSQ